MNTEEKRKALAKWILETDENVLNKVEAIYNTTSKIVAYTVSGEPLTREMYIQKVKDAEKKMEDGEFITSEDLKKKIASW